NKAAVIANNTFGNSKTSTTSFIKENVSTQSPTHNALLRGEQCTTKVTAHQLNHKTHRML
ncbi:hypothetical protein, partial [Vibrio navarrensis]|uniref:hypothetical protein n=1 Tax=Vibrio navarrensis TaxID=29495 RepID=UPI0029C060E4